MHTVKLSKDFKIRDEGEGFYSVISKLYGKKYFMQSGKFIIDQISQNYSLDSLVSNYKTLYKVDELIAKKDIYLFLQELQYMGLLRFNFDYFNDIIFPPNGTFCIAGDDDYVKLGKFIRNNLKSDNMIYTESNSLMYYNDCNIRYRCFHNVYSYFYCKDQDDNITIVIGLTGFIKRTQPATITLLFCNSNEDVFNKFMNNLKNLLICQGKTKMKFTSSKKPNTRLNQMLSNAGFELEAILRHEIGVEDQYIYSNIIK